MSEEASVVIEPSPQRLSSFSTIKSLILGLCVIASFGKELPPSSVANFIFKQS